MWVSSDVTAYFDCSCTCGSPMGHVGIARCFAGSPSGRFCGVSFGKMGAAVLATQWNSDSWWLNCALFVKHTHTQDRDMALFYGEGAARLPSSRSKSSAAGSIDVCQHWFQGFRDSGSGSKVGD